MELYNAKVVKKANVYFGGKVTSSETEYKTYGEGTSFVVPENSSFKIIVKEYADYCCSYK